MKLIAAITDGMQNPVESVLIATIFGLYLAWCIIQAIIEALRNGNG